MFGRFKLLSQFWKTGRLALRLARDSRVPMTAKLVLGATALYLISPIDVVPDWLPIVGQADDLMVLLAGLNMFIKACPRRLVDEHSGTLDRDRDDSSRDVWNDDGGVQPGRRSWDHMPGASSRSWGDEPPRERRDWEGDGVGAGSGRGSGQIIEGEYRRVR